MCSSALSNLDAAAPPSWPLCTDGEMCFSRSEGLKTPYRPGLFMHEQNRAASGHFTRHGQRPQLPKHCCSLTVVWVPRRASPVLGGAQSQQEDEVLVHSASYVEIPQQEQLL